jgi:flagellar biosynthesis GTPase FlhF
MSTLKHASSLSSASESYKIQEIFLMQNEIKSKFHPENIHNRCILLIGNTNVGKTTLLYYLSGLKLILNENK